MALFTSVPNLPHISHHIFDWFYFTLHLMESRGRSYYYPIVSTQSRGQSFIQVPYIKSRGSALQCNVRVKGDQHSHVDLVYYTLAHSEDYSATGRSACLGVAVRVIVILAQNRCENRLWNSKLYFFCFWQMLECYLGHRKLGVEGLEFRTPLSDTQMHCRRARMYYSQFQMLDLGTVATQ